MFKILKEILELKKTKLQMSVVLLNKVYDFAQKIEKLANTTDVLELSKKMKDVTQDNFVETIVENIKNNDINDKNI